MDLLKRLNQSRNAIFKLKVSGLITPSTTEKLKKELNKFRIHNPVALAVVINSMGGSAAQSSLIREELLSFASKRHIKIYCFAEDFAASGAYLILTAGSELFTAQSSLLGCIGSNFNFFDMSELASSYGVKRRQWSTSTKDFDTKLDVLSPLSAEAEAWAKEILAQSTQQLQKVIEEARGSKINKKDAFTGELFSGRQAVEIGLVDKVGTCEQVMENLYPNTRILDLTRKNLGFLYS